MAHGAAADLLVRRLHPCEEDSDTDQRHELLAREAERKMRIGQHLRILMGIAGVASLALSAAATSLPPQEDGAAVEPGIGCSIFVIQLGETVLFGNNVDDGNPNTYYSVVPAREEGEYGYITLGFNQPQGGLNEAGLVFDTNAVRLDRLAVDPNLPRHPEGTIGILLEMLRHAATVEQAIGIAQRYQWGVELSNQWLIADATGDAVVISAGRDGDLAFTRKPSGNGYLTSTNINRSHLLQVFACWRFRTISRMLRETLGRGSVTVEDVVAVLDAAHQEGVFLREGVLLNTVYSNVYDLNTREITLYYWYQFGAPVRLRLEEELAKGSRRLRIRDLFPTEVVRQASSENERLLESAGRRRGLVWGWTATLAATLLLGVILLCR